MKGQVLRTSPKYVFAGNDDYIYISLTSGAAEFSPNNGKSWFDFSSGLRRGSSIRSMLFTDEGTIFGGCERFGTYKANAPSGEDRLVVELNPEDFYLEWNESAEFILKVTDINDVPIESAAVQIHDSLNVLDSAILSDNNGEIRYKTTISEGTPNGNYPVSFIVSKENYVTFGPHYGSIRVMHKDTLHLIVNPDTTITVDWMDFNPNLNEYKILVVNDTGGYVNGAQIRIKDEIRDTSTIITSLNGRAFYRLVIHDSIPDGSYNITFTVTKEDFVSSDTLVRTIICKHIPVSVNELDISDGQGLAIIPNPVSGFAKIGFSLEKASQIRLSVFDILGREVAVIAEDYYKKGEHSLDFNCNLPEGIYFLRMAGGQGIISKPFLVNK